MRSRRSKIILSTLAAAAILIAAGGSFAEYRHEQTKLRSRAEAITGGDIVRGERAFVAYGCGGCHSVTGVAGAAGLVGPPLTGIGSRAIIAGRLENKPGNLMRWIMGPQQVSPGTAMPNLGVTPHDARDISAFLYTQS
jgi:cytochrome c2